MKIKKLIITCDVETVSGDKKNFFKLWNILFTLEV